MDACSASNYLLGLTPVQLAPFAAGTLSGMAAWCSVYGTLGGAGRSVLKQGTSLDALLAGEPCLKIHMCLDLLATTCLEGFSMFT